MCCEIFQDNHKGGAGSVDIWRYSTDNKVPSWNGLRTSCNLLKTTCFSASFEANSKFRTTLSCRKICRSACKGLENVSVCQQLRKECWQGPVSSRLWRRGEGPEVEEGQSPPFPLHISMRPLFICKTWISPPCFR